MDFLKEEIARKKRLIEEASILAPNKKYFKRSEILNHEDKLYLDKFRVHKNNKSNENEKKEEEEEEIINESHEKKFLSKDEEASTCTIPRDEVIRRLRERFQPIALFGESEIESLTRLLEYESEDDRSSGLSNDLVEALENVNREILQEAKAVRNSSLEAAYWTPKLSYEDLLKVGESLYKDQVSESCQIISEFIRILITKWEGDLSLRNHQVRLSVKGRLETGTFEQTKNYLKPLLRMLKKETITDDIRDSLTNMVKHCLSRNYIKCHEVYMEMAIGNAPWPIGVTNAGIHARPARENIFSKHVAHVLNDETQRKFIQGLKRLLTKAQEYYPTDPSRSIDYIKPSSQPILD